MQDNDDDDVGQELQETIRRLAAQVQILQQRLERNNAVQRGRRRPALEDEDGNDEASENSGAIRARHVFPNFFTGRTIWTFYFSENSTVQYFTCRKYVEG